MKSTLIAGTFAVLATSASAATLDFTTSDFATSPFTTAGTSAEVVVDGVSFTIAAVGGIASRFVQSSDDMGLLMSRQAGGMSNSLVISTDTDLQYLSIIGQDRSLQDQTTPLRFTVGTPQDGLTMDLTFGSSMGSLGVGPLNVATGELLTITPFFGVAPDYNRTFVSAVLNSIEFERVDIAPVPLPYGAVMFASAFGLFGAVSTLFTRRRRSLLAAS